MDGRAVVEWCRQQRGATEERPFGPEAQVFKVAGRMFAVCPAVESPDRVTLKGDPDLAVTLREQYPGVRPGYHANKRHWNTIALDGSVPSGVVAQLLEDSYRLVVRSLPARLRPSI